MQEPADLNYQQVVSRSGQHLKLLADRLHGVELHLAAAATKGYGLHPGTTRGLQGIDLVQQELRALAVILTELSEALPTATDPDLSPSIEKHRLEGLAAALHGFAPQPEPIDVVLF